MRAGAQVVVGLLLGGCAQDVPTKFEQRCDSIGEGAQACMIECARVANPRSDEEGEDLVRECAGQCRELNCTRRVWFYWHRTSPFTGKYSEWRRCGLASPETQALCRKVGWQGTD